MVLFEIEVLMKKLFLVLCFWCVSLQGIETDFDCVVVGTSPISMFEALYKRCLGNRVLVVEQGAECGGAWKSITICGVPHVDLGCHEFGRDARLLKFLEEYAGCTMVASTPSLTKPVPNGEFYPSEGCYELSRNLEHLMRSLGIVVLLSTRLESVFVDTSRSIAEVRFNDRRYTTKKIVVTQCSEIKFDNPQIQNQSSRIHTYYHVGMLIADQTPPRFTYRNLSSHGASRTTNYTPYSVEMKGTGKQLITVQVHSEQAAKNVEKFLADLKKQGLIDANAQLIRTENYNYKQGHLDQSAIHKLGPEAQSIFEIINTNHITNISNYIEKWKKALKPWSEVAAQHPPVAA
jgi:hypothetical protein